MKAIDAGPLRVLDAGFNRLVEALRTTEDQLRFGQSMSALPGLCKRLRLDAGELRRTLEQQLGHGLALARDVGSDAGRPQQRTPDWDHQPPRASATELLAASMSRAKESLRSIEEHLRLIAPPLAAQAERLRYAAYAVEAAVLRPLTHGQRLATTRLYVLVTTSLARGDVVDVTAAAIRGGAQLIQLREKQMPLREQLALARELRELTAAHDVLFVVNDHVDLAALCGADGVHQGQDDLPPSEVRKVLGADAIVGVSTHAPDQARRAVDDGADYIGVGPVFPTQTKAHRSAVGLDYVRFVASEIAIPGFAIGSVNSQTLGDVLDAGATRVAVCTGIIGVDDVEGTARRFRSALDALAGPPTEGTQA